MRDTMLCRQDIFAWVAYANILTIPQSTMPMPLYTGFHFDYWHTIRVYARSYQRRFITYNASIVKGHGVNSAAAARMHVNKVIGSRWWCFDDGDYFDRAFICRFLDIGQHYRRNAASPASAAYYSLPPLPVVNVWWCSMTLWGALITTSMPLQRRRWAARWARR